MNTKAYDKLNYTMAIVGAAADGKRHGCIELVCPSYLLLSGQVRCFGQYRT